jgi:hypothetical protein
LTRQERRHAARGQHKRTHPKTKPTAQPTPISLAEFVPTHPADYRAGVSKVRLASGHFIDRLDMSAWHEAGHAIAFLALGWSIRYLSVTRPAAGLTDPTYTTPDWWAGECRADPPPMPDRDHELRQYYAMAVATMAGPVAARTVRIDLGLQTVRDAELHTETLNAEGDGLTLTLAQTVLGIAPAEAAAFERDLREEATALLIAHRRVYGALVAALLAHRLLNAAEVAAVWQRGAFAFTGRIGRLAVVARRSDLPPDPDRSLPPFLIREQVGCTGCAQSWVDFGTAASRRSVVPAQRSDSPRGFSMIRHRLKKRVEGGTSDGPREFRS